MHQHETQAGLTVRQDFGGTQLAQQAEMAAIAAAAQAKAAVESRYIIAMRQPRDLDDVRARLLRECSRPGFAEVARYKKPIGKGVEGPSIRFAEAAIRCMSNVFVEQIVTYDDSSKRVVRVTVTDLESNAAYSRDVTIPKTVERSKLEPGRTVYSQRSNSYGKPVYTVSATDDEILDKELALISKGIRTLALRLIPGDLVDEAMARVLATLESKDKADPDAARKRLLDAFGHVGVSVPEIKKYLGLDDLGQISPADLSDLRAVYAALRDEEATWREILAARLAERGEEKSDKAEPAESTEKSAALKDKLAKRVGGTPSPAEASATSSTLLETREEAIAEGKVAK